jgi:hypothetical protein
MVLIGLFRLKANQNRIPFDGYNKYCADYAMSCSERQVLTFFSKSTSSLLAFFSYPGGGKGKQRDIEQKPKTQNSNAFHQRK